jgi:peptidoglycan/xylan/chitin deacetylase (PgdA/CDA1 family)
VIILNFHGIGTARRRIDTNEGSRWLGQESFEAVLDLARGNEHVRLTFDDGNVSDIEIVLPALLMRSMRATFFICTSRLDKPGFLSQAQVRELQAHGMRIGSHGIAHLSWRRLPGNLLWEEVAGSKRVLERVCGNLIEAAACPFGAYDRTVLSDLRRAGYRAVYTSDGGVSGADHWLRGRNTVTRSMSIADVARLVQRRPGVWKQALIRTRQMVKRLR